MGVTLALDVGGKRIGTACSDPLGIAALPLEAIMRTNLEADLEAARALAEARGAERIVIGLPKTLRNEIGPQAQRTLAFARALEKRVACPVEMWDERLTTAEAQRAFQGVSPKKRRRNRAKGVVDSAAAALILRSFLAGRSVGG